VAGTVAAIVFGTIGATIAITKLLWDRRDRRAHELRKAEEAAVLAHENERLRRERAQWQAADQAYDEAHRFRVYSEAEARRFLSQPQATPQDEAVRGRARVGLRVGIGLIALLSLAAILWLILFR
jgi:hypothetical protein